MESRRFQTVILLMFIILSLLGTLFLNISPVFKNIARISGAWAIGFGIWLYTKERFKSLSTTASLVPGIIFALGALYVQFTGLFFYIFSISAYLIIGFFRKVSAKVIPLTLTIFFFTSLGSLLFAYILGEIFQLNITSSYIVLTIAYFAIWFLFAVFGGIEKTRLAAANIGVAALILLMLLTLIIDIIPPVVFEKNITSRYMLLQLKALGYKGKDILYLFVKILTFPPIIASIVSYLILEYRNK